MTVCHTYAHICRYKFNIDTYMHMLIYMYLYIMYNVHIHKYVNIYI